MFAAKGINLERARAHGLYRYAETDDARVVEEYRPHYPHLGVVRRVVRQSGGLVMPKFPLPGTEPIPPQLDPDAIGGVVTDPRVKWHKHDRVREGIKVVPVRGKGLEISMELAELHVARSRTKDRYDRATGEGDHAGANVNGFHRHAPKKAKYVNFGPSKRIDVGPDGLEAVRQAYLAGDLWPGMYFGLEGKKKYLAAESNGWHGASILSITPWQEREVRWLAAWVREQIPGTPVFINPDADWAEFQRNHGAVFRQAMFVQTIFREELVDAYMIAPPIPAGTTECKHEPGRVTGAGTCAICGGYFKAFDDWYGAGGTTADLVVLAREEPRHIVGYVLGLPIPHQRKGRTARALRGLSLHDRDDCDLLNAPLKTLQRIMGARRPQDVPGILVDVADAIEIRGSREIEKRSYVDEHGRLCTVWDWRDRPQLRVKDAFRAAEHTVRVGDSARVRLAA